MNKWLRHFLIYGSFRPALTPNREKIYIRSRIVDAVIVFMVFFGILALTFLQNDQYFIILFFVLGAAGILILAYRIGRGRTYLQLIRKDVKEGKLESEAILKSLGAKNGQK